MKKILFAVVCAVSAALLAGCEEEVSRPAATSENSPAPTGIVPRDTSAEPELTAADDVSAAASVSSSTTALTTPSTLTLTTPASPSLTEPAEPELT
ncbi:MAG: hypothetical protein K2O14_13360, partial [Oscillospiraceae bacterium]|nr:hypothetical protein [Oscillospiraceae bacterium]